MQKRRAKFAFFFVGFLTLGGFSSVEAQVSPCAAQELKTSVLLVYPPIAKAARVEGTVVLLVAFTPAGDVANIKAVSGPEMLKGAAMNFAKGWQAAAFTGVRECPFAVRFQMVGVEHDCREDAKPVVIPPSSFTDPQHYVITAARGCFNVLYGAASSRS